MKDYGDLAIKIAALWRRQRRQFSIHGGMDPALVRALDELQTATLGDPRRCQCFAFKDSGGKRHDVLCPGRPRE